MEDLRKQIFLDLCVTPGTMIPGVLGGTLMLLAFAGLGGPGAFFRFICLLVGFGTLVTNLIFRMEAVSQRAATKWQKGQSAKKNAELDALDKKLVKTRDKKDETALRNLRALYDSFTKDHAKGKINSNVPPMMLGQIDEIFQVCIQQLRTSVEIHEQSKQVTGDLKTTLKNQRSEMVADVESGVKTLATVINEVRALSHGTDRRTLKKIQDRLNSQLNVAKATEQQIAALESIGDDDLDRFSEYE